jgi:hypothetical protein
LRGEKIIFDILLRATLTSGAENFEYLFQKFCLLVGGYKFALQWERIEDK